MNSRFYISICISALLLSFSSCSTDDTVIEDDGQVRFTAGIQQAAPNTPASRAAGDAWAQGDAIGIFMVAHGTTTISEGAENYKFTTTGSTSFTPVAGNEIFYPMDGSLVDFVAYYPYRPDAALGTAIDVALGDQDNQPSFDLVWAKVNNSDAGFSKSVSGAVALGFNHKLAKLVMNCKPGDGVTANDLKNGMTVSIKGTKTTNTFDLATGTLGTPETVATIAPRKLATVPQGGGYAVAYDAIIIPGSYAKGAVTVEFTIGSDVFTWTADALTFDGGNEYIYDVNITRTGVTMTGTISAWRTHVKDNVKAW